VAAALAGCTQPPDTGTSTAEETGTFELLVTDTSPADIGDFSALEVTFEKAWIFPKNTGDGSKGFEVRDPDNPNYFPPIHLFQYIFNGVIRMASQGGGTHGETGTASKRRRSS
jgi:hypothetical protein